MEIDKAEKGECSARSRRSRSDSCRSLFGTSSSDNSLELSGVLSVLDEYDDYEGGVNCRVCGKLYKSRVCFTKHLWEHTIYWEVFKGEKNHDRVLSIQAAIILWNRCQANSAGYHGNNPSIKSNLDSLLVTSPHKKERDINDNELVDGSQAALDGLCSSHQKNQIRGKRKRLLSDSGIISDSFPTSPHSDVGSPAKLTRQC